MKFAYKQDVERRYGSTVALFGANPVIIVEIAWGRDSESGAGESAAHFRSPSARRVCDEDAQLMRFNGQCLFDKILSIDFLN